VFVPVQFVALPDVMAGVIAVELTLCAVAITGKFPLYNNAVS
jgi:hypothetical protein